MHFVISAGTETEFVERYDSASLALDAVSSLLAEGRPNVSIFNENGWRVSLAALQALASFENESDDA